MSDPSLVTTYNFNGRDYFVKMNAANNVLELVLTDKQTGEDWQCCYEAPYIENITQKTGNFKQFKIFIVMLKSGLLKTSSSVYLDLMTFDDLEALRNHRIRGPYSSYHIAQTNSNRRYLILTYTVEFDKIHYPLPLEYCGPPDPQVLQKHILKLEDELGRLREQVKQPNKQKSETKFILTLQKRIEDLTEENHQLREEIKRLTTLQENRSKCKQILMLQNAIRSLEKSVISERKSHYQLVDKLKKEKIALSKELDRAKQSEKSLRAQFEATRFSRHQHSIWMSDPGGRGESRSPSPKLWRNESWSTQQPIRNKSPISRSPRTKFKKDHEVSRRKEHESEDSESSGAKRHSTQNRRKSAGVSRSSSASSRSSGASNRGGIPKRISQHLGRIASAQKNPSRSSELDFSVLENRIQALQEMLHKGLITT